MNYFSKARYLFTTCLVLIAGATVSGASDPLSASLPASSEYAVVSMVAGTGGVILSSRHFEDEVELSVGLDSDGKVRINGAVVGDHDPSEANTVEVNCSAGLASVIVRRASCGTVICSDSNSAVVIASDMASATGGAVSLDVSQ
jgi:hypothetical protein